MNRVWHRDMSQPNVLLVALAIPLMACGGSDRSQDATLRAANGQTGDARSADSAAVVRRAIRLLHGEDAPAMQVLEYDADSAGFLVELLPAPHPDPGVVYVRAGGRVRVNRDGSTQVIERFR